MAGVGARDLDGNALELLYLLQKRNKVCQAREHLRNLKVVPVAFNPFLDDSTNSKKMKQVKTRRRR